MPRKASPAAETPQNLTPSNLPDAQPAGLPQGIVKPMGNVPMSDPIVVNAPGTPTEIINPALPISREDGIGGATETQVGTPARAAAVQSGAIPQDMRIHQPGPAQPSNLGIVQKFVEADKSPKMPVRNIQIDPGAFRVNIRAIVPKAHNIDDIMNPTYWSMVAGKFGLPGNSLFPRVEAIAEDGSWLADLVVSDFSNSFAAVTVLSYVELASASGLGDVPSGYEVTFAGYQDKWVVIRKSDDRMIETGLKNQAEAKLALQEHLKAIGR